MWLAFNLKINKIILNKLYNHPHLKNKIIIIFNVCYGYTTG